MLKPYCFEEHLSQLGNDPSDKGVFARYYFRLRRSKLIRLKKESFDKPSPKAVLRALVILEADIIRMRHILENSFFPQYYGEAEHEHTGSE